MEIILKEFKHDHLEWFLEIRNHISTRSQLKNNSIFTIEQAIEWYQKLDSPWYVIENQESDLVGYIRTNGYEIGCDIHPDFRRMGYARKAYKKFLKGVKYAELDVFEDNFAKKLYNELGFRENGKSTYIRERKYIKMIYNKP